MKKHQLLQLFLISFVILNYLYIQAQTKSTSLEVDIPFGENESISDLKTIDLNNDGKDELIVLVESSVDYLCTYRWYDSYFQEIWTAEFGFSNWVYGMQTTDFDNDGKTDLLVSWEIGNPNLFLSFYKNYGDVFVDQGPLIIHCPDATFCAYDLNGDTLIDLATGSVFGNSGFSIQLYKHNSINQTVQYVGLLPDATNGANMVKSLNINNDNKMDILGAEKYSGILYTYMNNGDLNFSQTYFYQFDNYIRTIETADFDNDSLEDFVANETLSKLFFFRNNGDGGFEIVFESSENETWNGTEASDLNHDGKIDLVAQTFKGRIYLFKNMGDFSFEELVYASSDTILYNLSLGDFDGNGEVDMAFGKNPVHVVFDAINYFIPVSVHEKHLIKNDELSISQIYPNPCKNKISISFYQTGKIVSAQLIIFDQTGKQITKIYIDPDSTKTVIETTLFNSGVYFLQLKTKSGFSETKKMIKL